MRKRKNTGRLLSILLCLAMVLGMLSTTALADEPQPEGDPMPEPISFSVKKTDDNGSPLKGAYFELTPVQGTNGEGKFAYSDETALPPLIPTSPPVHTSFSRRKRPLAISLPATNIS